MNTVREMFEFSRAEMFAVVVLLLMILVGGGILFYQKNSESLPAELFIESIKSEANASPVKSQSIKHADSLTRVARAPLLVDINTASQDSFRMLPYVGQVLSKKIVQYRDSVGAFDSIGQLIEVRGIGPKNLSEIRKYLTITK